MGRDGRIEGSCLQPEAAAPKRNGDIAVAYGHGHFFGSEVSFRPYEDPDIASVVFLREASKRIGVVAIAETSEAVKSLGDYILKRHSSFDDGLEGLERLIHG